MTLVELARRLYEAYLADDRSFFASHMAPGFTFTSPYDDHIDKEAFFRRCWPDKPTARKFQFEAMAQDGDRVLTVYRLEIGDGAAGMTARNAECMTFENGKLKSVDVYFGDPPRNLTRRQFAEQSGAA